MYCQWVLRLVGAACLAALCGCGTPGSMLQTSDERARATLAANGFELLPASPYVLAALHPTPGPPQRLTVFIEGDGASWPRPSVPPSDPTPGKPLSLLLAVAHVNAQLPPGEAVAYLGRPCQYLSGGDLANCPGAWWTLGRFGTAPLKLMNARLDALKAQLPNAALRLVGYSGGGAAAALLAAQRSDVACLVTVAAPLDTNAWTRAKNVSALSESQNPLDVAAQLRGMPMTHFSGADDDVVPRGVNQKFMQAAQTREQLQSGFDHDAQWLKAWPALALASCLTN